MSDHIERVQLSRRLIRSDEWTAREAWAPGMKEIGDGRRVVNSYGRICTWADVDGIGSGDWVGEGRLPDLSDPATVGAVYAQLQARDGHVFVTPCPFATYAAAYGMTHINTVRALVEAFEKPYRLDGGGDV